MKLLSGAARVALNFTVRHEIPYLGGEKALFLTEMLASGSEQFRARRWLQSGCQMGKTARPINLNFDGRWPTVKSNKEMTVVRRLHGCTFVKYVWVMRDLTGKCQIVCFMHGG
jgi:hypothetical protein